MSDEYTGSFTPGDRVFCTGDQIDGSYEGEEGTVVKTYFQKGGAFAPSRNCELVLFDVDKTDEFDASTEEGRARMLASYEVDGDPFLADSDTFTFESV